MAEGGHVDETGFAAEGRGLLEVGAAEGLLVPLECAGGGEDCAAAAIFPRAGEGGEHGDGADGGSAELGALDAVVEAEGGGASGGVFAGELLDFCGGHAGPVGYALGGVFAGALGETVEAVGHFVDVGAVFKAFVEDDVHHAEGEGGVGAGTDGDVPVGKGGGAGAVGIDDDEARAVAAGLLDHGPEVDVVAVNVRAPGEDEFGEAEVFSGGAELFSVDGVPGLAAGFRTDGAVEAAGAEAVKEAAVHGAVAELADGAGVAVGKDGLGAVLIADLLEARGDGGEGFVPGDALEGFVFAAAGEWVVWRTPGLRRRG